MYATAVIPLVMIILSSDSTRDVANLPTRKIDISDEVQFVGRLGLPIGTPFKAKVVKRKGSIDVVEVDGKLVQPSVTFTDEEYERVDDYSHLLWAWETGALVEEIPVRPTAGPAVPARLKFRSYLCLERKVEPNDSSIAPRNQTHLMPVAVKDIGKSVMMRGKLGSMLGEWIEIEGRWELEGVQSKDGEYRWRFTVLRVNGSPYVDRGYKSNAQMRLPDIEPAADGIAVEPTAGQLWRLEAYETFSVGGVPDSVKRLRLINGRMPREYGVHSGLRWRRLKVLPEE